MLCSLMLPVRDLGPARPVSPGPRSLIWGLGTSLLAEPGHAVLQGLCEALGACLQNLSTSREQCIYKWCDSGPFEVWCLKFVGQLFLKPDVPSLPR